MRFTPPLPRRCDIARTTRGSAIAQMRAGKANSSKPCFQGRTAELGGSPAGYNVTAIARRVSVGHNMVKVKFGEHRRAMRVTNLGEANGDPKTVTGLRRRSDCWTDIGRPATPVAEEQFSLLARLASLCRHASLRQARCA